MEKTRLETVAAVDDAREAFETHSAAIAQAREASEREIAQFLSNLKEFMANQAAVNISVARIQDTTSARLQQIGDMVMQQSAIVGMHTEVMRAKGLIGGG